MVLPVVLPPMLGAVTGTVTGGIPGGFYFAMSNWVNEKLFGTQRKKEYFKGRSDTEARVKQEEENLERQFIQYLEYIAKQQGGENIKRILEQARANNDKIPIIEQWLQRYTPATLSDYQRNVPYIFVKSTLNYNPIIYSRNNKEGINQRIKKLLSKNNIKTVIGRNPNDKLKTLRQSGSFLNFTKNVRLIDLKYDWLGTQVIDNSHSWNTKSDCNGYCIIPNPNIIKTNRFRHIRLSGIDYGSHSSNSKVDAFRVGFDYPIIPNIVQANPQFKALVSELVPNPKERGDTIHAFEKTVSDMTVYQIVEYNSNDNLKAYRFYCVNEKDSKPNDFEVILYLNKASNHLAQSNFDTHAELLLKEATEAPSEKP